MAKEFYVQQNSFHVTCKYLEILTIWHFKRVVPRTGSPYQKKTFINRQFSGTCTTRPPSVYVHQMSCISWPLVFCSIHYLVRSIQTTQKRALIPWTSGGRKYPDGIFLQSVIQPEYSSSNKAKEPSENLGNSVTWHLYSPAQVRLTEFCCTNILLW